MQEPKISVTRTFYNRPEYIFFAVDGQREDGFIKLDTAITTYKIEYLDTELTVVLRGDCQHSFAFETIKDKVTELLKELQKVKP